MMIAPTFAERYQRARLYASQVRVRRAMGDRYEHAPSRIKRQHRGNRK